MRSGTWMRAGWVVVLGLFLLPVQGAPLPRDAEDGEIFCRGSSGRRDRGSGRDSGRTEVTGEEPFFQPFTFEFAELEDQQREDYLALERAMAAEQEGNSPVADRLRNGFGESESGITRAFVPLLEGKRFYEQGMLDLAEEAYLRCFEANPNEVVANLELGRVCWDLRRLDEAKLHIARFVAAMEGDERTRSVYPDWVFNGYILLSRLATEEQDYERARTLLEKAEEVEFPLGDELLGALTLADRVRAEGPANWTFGNGGNAWKVESDHYVIMSNVDEDFTEDLSAKAEIVRGVFDREFRFLGDSPQEHPSTIIVFSDRGEFDRFNRELKGDRIGPGVVGYFDPMSKFLVLYNDQTLSYALEQSGKDFPEVLKTLYHEMFHQFIDQYTGDCPGWINEGLASIYENLRVAGRNARMFNNCQYHLEYIREIAQGTAQHMGGPRDLLTVDGVVRMEKGFPFFYDYSCILQFFFRDKYGDLRQQLVEAIRSGIRDEERLLEIIGNAPRRGGLERMNEEWADYCRKLHR